MNGKQYQIQNGTLVDITPRIAAMGAGGHTYTGVTPITVDNTNDTVSVATATTAAKGVVQVGNNIDVSTGTISVKPWATYAASSASVDVSTLQDGALVQTDEDRVAPSAVLAQIEQSLSGSVSAVPSSYAVKTGGAHLAMPSSRYVDLTLPANFTITAPADGYVYFSQYGTAGGQLVDLVNETTSFASRSVAYSNAAAAVVWCPVSAGDTVRVSSTLAGSVVNFRFYYANGVA